MALYESTLVMNDASKINVLFIIVNLCCICILFGLGLYRLILVLVISGNGVSFPPTGQDCLPEWGKEGAGEPQK